MGRAALYRGRSICIPKCASRWADHFKVKFTLLDLLNPILYKIIKKIFYSFVFPVYFKSPLFKVPETFILVPALLGLKGNLEMTLASRLSTFVSYRRWIIAVTSYSSFFFCRQIWVIWIPLSSGKKSSLPIWPWFKCRRLWWLSSRVLSLSLWLGFRGDRLVCVCVWFFCENCYFYQKVTNGRNFSFSCKLNELNIDTLRQDTLYT